MFKRTVREKATISIHASKDTVWQILTDFQRWPVWNSDVIDMHYEGPLVVGTTFTWKGGGLNIVSTVTDIKPNSSITWKGRAFGINAEHTYRLSEHDNTVHVETEETFTGLLPTLMPRYMQKVLKKSLASGLEKLKVEAENIES